MIKDCIMEAVTDLCPEKINMFKMVSLAPNIIDEYKYNMLNISETTFLNKQLIKHKVSIGTLWLWTNQLIFLIPHSLWYVFVALTIILTLRRN